MRDFFFQPGGILYNGCCWVRVGWVGLGWVG